MNLKAKSKTLFYALISAALIAGIFTGCGQQAATTIETKYLDTVEETTQPSVSQMSEETDAAQAAWFDLYAQTLSGRKNLLYYDVFDMDEDGVPELFFSEAASFSGDDVLEFNDYIYTVSNGKAAQIFDNEKNSHRFSCFFTDQRDEGNYIVVWGSVLQCYRKEGNKLIEKTYDMVSENVPLFIDNYSDRVDWLTHENDKKLISAPDVSPQAIEAAWNREPHANNTKCLNEYVAQF